MGAMHRVVLVALAAAAGAALASGCSSFGVEEATPVGDGGADAAPASDATGGAAEACTGPITVGGPAKCKAGGCARRVLYPDTNALFASVNGNVVHVVDDKHELMRGELPAGPLKKIGTTIVSPSIKAFTADATHVYVTTPAGQDRRSATTGEPDPGPYISAAPGTLVVGRDFAYVLSPTRLVKAPKTLGADEKTLDVTDGRDVAVAGNDAFWIDRNTATGRHVVRGPLESAQVYDALGDPERIAADEQFVFAVDATPPASRIMRLSRTTGRVEQIAVEPGAVGRLYARGGFVYWIAYRSLPEAQVVGRVSRCGGDAVLLESGVKSLSAISIADDAIYYAAEFKLHAVATQ